MSRAFGIILHILQLFLGSKFCRNSAGASTFYSISSLVVTGDDPSFSWKINVRKPSHPSSTTQIRQETRAATLAYSKWDIGRRETGNQMLPHSPLQVQNGGWEGDAGDFLLFFFFGAPLCLLSVYKGHLGKKRFDVCWQAWPRESPPPVNNNQNNHN